MNKKKLKILIMSVPIGSGHTLAAEALKEEFEQKYNCEVIMGNAFDFMPKFCGNVFITGYLFILKYCPIFYKWAYKIGNNDDGSLWLRNTLNYILGHLAEKYLNKLQPDCVIATHVTPAGIISSYKQRHPQNKMFLASVMTDYAIHKWWICNNTNVYFLAANDLLADYSRLNINSYYTYGIPVRMAFRQEYNRVELRKKFGWTTDIKVCLLIGGGEGLLPMKKILTAIKYQDEHNLRFVAITGRNEDLEESIRVSFPQVEVYGFTNEVSELMHAADVIVSKAGGLTAAETITTNLKYIIYHPLAGQEEDNAVYLEKRELATIVHEPEELFAAIMSDNGNKETIEQKKVRSESAGLIANKVFELVTAFKAKS